MKIAIATALSLLTLVAPAYAAEIEERRFTSFANQFGIRTQTIHDLSTTTKTVTATVTVHDGAVGNNNNQQTVQAAPTSPPVRVNNPPQRFTSRRRHRTVVTKPVTQTITRNQVVTHTVTVPRRITRTDRRGATITETATITQTVVSTATQDVTTTVEKPVTVTVEEPPAAETGSDDDAPETGSDAEVNTTTSDPEGTIVNNEPTGTDNNDPSNTDTADPPAGTDDEDPQKSLNLDPRLIQPNLALTGQETPTPGQVESLTTTNNFINFCLTQPVPLTDGKQIREGSCNVVPMGIIVAKDKAPSGKFVFPENFGTVPANQAFTVKLKLRNFQAGAFTNAQLNYYGAPQTVNDQGIVIGHSHVVIEQLPSLDSTEPLDPTTFAFFKGLNAPLDGQGLLTTTLDKGLPAGFYRAMSINTASNHQPVLQAVAQHGSHDDGIYFTVA